MLKLKFRKKKTARQPGDGMFRTLEHFLQCCSVADGVVKPAVFLGFGFVSAQSQGSFEPVPSPNPRQNSKTLAPPRYIISVNALWAGDATRCLLRRHSLSQRDKLHLHGNPGESDLIAPSRTLKMITMALSPLPGLGTSARLTHSWRYALLSGAAPQLGAKVDGWPVSQNMKITKQSHRENLFSAMMTMERSGNDEFEKLKTNPPTHLKPLNTMPNQERTVCRLPVGDTAEYHSALLWSTFIPNVLFRNPQNHRPSAFVRPCPTFDLKKQPTCRWIQ